MRTRTRENEEWPCTRFCRIDVTDTDTVADFILWLCGRDGIDTDAFDPIEDMWLWQAPRNRMAKLLWQCLQSDPSDTNFEQRFTYGRVFEDTGSCADILPPIQDRLKQTMEAFLARREQDREFGQGRWGEEWWLSAERAAFVRSQLRRAQPDLLEQSSDYEDMLRATFGSMLRRAGVIPIESDDPARVYIGTRKNRVHVCVKTSAGYRYPLRQTLYAGQYADGFNFEWGYPGDGPFQLATCILTDAAGGDLEFSLKVASDFSKEVITPHPRSKSIRMPHADVMAWIERRGVLKELNDRKHIVAERLENFAGTIRKREELLKQLELTGGLRAQRFDIVPVDFECALYVDLMNMLENSGFAMRCSRCGLPIAADQSDRANRQRARWDKGEPVYHPDCFSQHARERKAKYWQKQAQSTVFKERQRIRGRKYRKQRGAEEKTITNA